MFLSKSYGEEVLRRCQEDPTLDLVDEMEKAEFDCFKTTYGGTKGDYFLKKIIQKILKNGTYDINPRPVYKKEVFLTGEFDTLTFKPIDVAEAKKTLEFKGFTFLKGLLYGYDVYDNLITIHVPFKLVKHDDVTGYDVISLYKFIDENGTPVVPSEEEYIVREPNKDCYMLYTPAHTISINKCVMSYDLSKGECPALTLRYTAWKSAVKEIFWIYQMQSNKLEDLHNMGINYWDAWDVGDGTIGYRYGHTIKRYDLMNKLLNGLVNDPFGRRHMMEMWQYTEFEESNGLNPCCHLTTWNVRQGENGVLYLDMEMKQRSSDFTVSNAINELQYIALMLMVAKHCGYTPGVFTHISTNVQIYDRHIENAKELLNRKPVDIPNVQLVLDTDKTDFYSFTIDDFKLVNYDKKLIDETNPQMNFDLGI